MSQILAVELSDAAYEGLRRLAETTGTSPENVAALALEKQYSESVCQLAKGSQAREQFEKAFGSVDLGRPTGADNDGIDKDLVNEYAGQHEAP